MVDGFLRVGHRGAPREFPANTMKSFARAVERGCQMVECDVRLSSDGALMLAHDPHVIDKDGRRWDVGAHTRDALRGFDLGAGEGVPTLEELVTFSRERGCALMADMKCEGSGVEEKVAAALSPLPRESKIVPGAPEDSRKRFRAIDPTLPLSFSCGAFPPLSDAQFAEMLPAIDTDAVTWEHPLLTAERIAALHERGLRVFAWTVDDPAVMRRLVTDGVDGIISNRADLLENLQDP